MKIVVVAVEALSMELMAAWSCRVSVAMMMSEDEGRRGKLTEVYWPPDLATTLAPAGGEVRDTAWTPSARTRNVKNERSIVNCCKDPVTD